MACQACRTKKIKCDRVRPVCQNCRLRASQCSYAGERRTRRWVAEADAENRRLSGFHPSPRESNHRPSQRPTDTVSGSGSDSSAGQQQPEPRHQQSTARSAHLWTDVAARTDVGTDQPDWRAVIPASSDWNHIDSDSIAGVSTHIDHDSEAIPNSPVGFPSNEDGILVDKILDGDDLGCLKDANPSLWMRMDDGDEYTGPSSGISSISDLGLSWVRQNVPESDDLCEAIQDVRNAILCHLRQPKCIPQDLPLALTTPRQTADVSPSQMLQYIDAYFSKVQVVFPILDRDTFLSQLSAMGSNAGPIPKPSWLALLNAVLASGCRASLSDETAEAFQTSGSEAWGYFQFALSYESQIIHGSTDLMAVQAMAVMTVFAQGLSSPQRLEYTLSSVTSRLAHGLGLHRNPPHEWNLAEDENKERNRVFWAVYCLDKSIALRCGRPAVICDEEVSCCFPRGIGSVNRASGGAAIGPDEVPVVVDFFRCFAKLMRIGGNISRSLYSASALLMPVSRLVPTLNRLLQGLETWLNSINPDIRPGRSLNKILGRQGISRDEVIVLHSSYYYVLCCIFRRASPMFTQGIRSVEHLIDRRSHISHIEAARSIVLLTKHFDIESFSPAWLVFYYPFTALTTIFVYVTSNPPDTRTQSDIALMETAVGFFGRLEHVTSGEAAFTKTTEFVRQARKLTEQFNNKDGAGQKRAAPSMDISLHQCGRVEILEAFANGFGNGQVGETESYLEPDFIATRDIDSLCSDPARILASTTKAPIRAQW